MSPTPSFDEDALIAAVDLIGRSGATSYEGGWVHDDVPAHKAGWWATAHYQGTRLTAEDHPGPVEAAEALARRILSGAKCKHCGGLVALSDAGAYFPDPDGGPVTMADGSTWTVEEARARPQCRWRRQGARWARGCETPDRETPGPARAEVPNRAARRRAARAARRA